MHYDLPDNFEQKIEFLKVRQLLVDRCLSPLGEEKVEEMCFLTSYNEIEARLAQTEEFVRLREEEDAFPMDGFHDTRAELKPDSGGGGVDRAGSTV